MAWLGKAGHGRERRNGHLAIGVRFRMPSSRPARPYPAKPCPASPYRAKPSVRGPGVEPDLRPSAPLISALPSHAVSCRTEPRLAAPRRRPALPCPARTSHTAPCHAEPSVCARGVEPLIRPSARHVPRLASPSHAVPYQAEPNLAMPSHAPTSRARPCPTMPRHTSPCHAQRACPGIEPGKNRSRPYPCPAIPRLAKP